MVLKKGDFIEIEFLGKTEDGEIFDTNIKEELKKMNIDSERKTIICIGEGMILKSIDNFLLGKDLGEYILKLKPEEAFGLRKKELIKLMPISVFKNSKEKLQPGMIFSFDNILGKIISISGGRVLVDFNNPLAGKNIIYEINIKSKIEDINEKIKALMNYFFKREFEYEIKDKKLIIEAEKNFFSFINLFKDNFKRILDLEIEIKEK
ncbi:MAG: peptidylprolyl isomerase [Candidatus Pacearchaeota archaeon]